MDIDVPTWNPYRAKKIHVQLQSEYFFCSITGKRIDLSNIRERVWIPAIEKTSLQFREMKQTRHSFATIHLGRGKDPLLIAKIMGHRDTDMVNRVYAKYIENTSGINNENDLDDVYQGFMDKKE